jgi:hypothetical protein
LIIRHCVEETNIDENYLVVDPTLIKHVTVSGGKIDSMSGFIDPASHLNIDYSLHKVTKCIIAEKFEIGARIKIEGNGLVFALVGPSSYDHYGKVDYTQRLTDMIDKVKGEVKEREKEKERKKRGVNEKDVRSRKENKLSPTQPMASNSNTSTASNSNNVTEYQGMNQM